MFRLLLAIFKRNIQLIAGSYSTYNRHWDGGQYVNIVSIKATLREELSWNGDYYLAKNLLTFHLHFTHRVH
jgi:hypothetical protein